MDAAVSTLKTKNLNIRTSEADYEAIRKVAQFNGQSMSAFVMNLVYDYLDDLEDMKAIKEHERAKARGEVKYFTLDEVMEMHDIDL